jgi:colicin import membrane protein
MLARVNEASKELARANSVLDAKDAADAKGRDAEDAARIRAGDAPEDVRADRAGFDRDQEIKKINRELEEKAADARAKREAAEQAKVDRDKVFRNPSNTPEQKAKVALTANAADNQADEAERDLQTAQSIAEQRRRGVNIQSDAKVSDAQGDKAARLKREQDAADAKAQREKQQAEDKARREREAAARAAEQTAAGRNRDLAGVGRDAVSLIPKGASEKARAAVEAAAAKLNDGDQGGEVAALLKLVEQMAGYIEGTQGKESANAVKISQLEARITALRNNGKK